MFNELAKRKKADREKLINYGFVDQGDCFQYTTQISGGAFTLVIRIDKSGRIDTELFEQECQEEYMLYKTSAVGSFVGEIRATIGDVVSDIVQKCYDTEIFKMQQTQRIIEFVRQKYEDELEFLWPSSPGNAIWRRKDNKKWYGVVITVSGKKIGLQTDDLIEIIDLRMPPEEAEERLSQLHYYPGWHMNKKSWYTLVLDESISDEELRMRIEESYDLAKK